MTGRLFYLWDRSRQEKKKLQPCCNWQEENNKYELCWSGSEVEKNKLKKSNKQSQQNKVLPIDQVTASFDGKLLQPEKRIMVARPVW